MKLHRKAMTTARSSCASTGAANLTSRNKGKAEGWVMK
jgi:hypothetical protein